MKRRLVLLIEDDGKNLAFFEDYFSDTRSDLLVCTAPGKIAEVLKRAPEFIFMNPETVPSNVPKTLFAHAATAGPKIISMGSYPEHPELPVVPLPLEVPSFQRKLFAITALPPFLKVLVIDDEQEICDGIREYLECRTAPSFKVETAPNGLEGFRKIESWKPDVTILDIKMPVKSGLELGREVQKRYPELRVIVLTAAVSSDEILALRKVGIPAFVEKSSSGGSFPELLNLIKKQYLFS